MKRSLLVLLIINSFLLGGCFNYRDLNRLFFTTVAVADVDEDGSLILYSENFKAYRGQGEKQGTEVKVVFKGVGKTVYDAYNQIIQTASYEINYSQIKAVIFTERAARYGIDNFIDGIVRDQKPTLRTFLFVYPGDPQELLEVKLADEQFLGLFLDNLMVSQGKLSNVMQIRLDEYINRRLQGSKVAAIPILKVNTTLSEKRVIASGAAVFVNDKMVDKLNDEEVIAYNYVINEATTGFMHARNPQENNKLVALKILKSKTKIMVNYDGEAIHLIKNIKAKVTLVETQKSLNLSDKEIRNEIERDAEERIRKNCIDLYERFREKGIDIFNVQKRFERKYPHEKVENVLEITKPETNVDIFIEGSNNTTDFK